MKYNAVLFDYGGTLGGSGKTEWVTTMIRQLFESGYRVAIVSNSNRYGDARWLRRRCADKGWSEYIEHIFGSGGMLGLATKNGSAGCHKPNPEIYQRVLYALGLHHKPETVLFVGDSIEADVYAPKSLGMDAILIDLKKGDYSPEIWNRLGDKPTSRSNVLTEFSRDGKKRITTRLKHLTEPLRKGEEILIGTSMVTVDAWDIEHTKDDILDTTKNHRVSINIVIR